VKAATRQATVTAPMVAPRWRPSDDRAHHRLFGAQPPARPDTDGAGLRLRRPVPAGRAPRCAAGPVRHAGHRLHDLGPLARPDRGPGHLPHRQRPAGGARRQGDPRLLGLRLLVRLRRVRGRHGPVLGPLPRARVPQRDPGAVARGRDARPGTGRLGRGLGLPVRAGRSRPEARSRRVALLPGLDPPLRAAGGRGRFRGRDRRRLCPPVPDHGRSRAPGRPAGAADGRGGRRARLEQRGGRAAARMERRRCR
jgi:hypothetical protein